ncbi:hypothetical protein MYP_5024 [Sporocytophaga myxococcoides]|nr:hypothetical protein MYP_5024 [Sporocytophaga myxococcoides]
MPEKTIMPLNGRTKAQMPEKTIMPLNGRTITSYDPKICSCCKTKTMVVIEIFDRRGPPFFFNINKTEVNI